MDNLKTKENFIEVLEHYSVSFDPNKGKQMVPCPYHDDHTPSLSIILEGDGWFKCFAGCGGGDIYNLVAMMEGLDCKTEFPKIVTKTKEILGVTEKVAEKTPIASYDYMVDGVVINTKNKFSKGDGKPYDWKIHKSEGGQFPIYNVDALKTAMQIVITEGEKDCETLRTNGITAISFPHGAETIKEEYINPLLSLKTVYIAYDNDTAGEKGRDKIITFLKEKGFSGQIFTVLWTDKKSGYDVTDWFNETSDPNKAKIFFKLFQEYKVDHTIKPGPNWPAPLGEAAYYGLAGRVINAIAPNTEADNAALLGHFLAMFGNAIGRHPHFVVEGTKHYTNLYLLFPGETSRGRKGSAYSQLKSLFRRIDSEWVKNNIELNCSTGEGIVNRVRDAQFEKKEIKDNGIAIGDFRLEIVDFGVTDKRLLLVEQEFASFLKLATREGNNLSPVVRMAWDGGDLGILTKHNPLKATDVHISIIAHITKNELLRYLNTTEACNGFANRFLWVCSKRSKFLPYGGAIDPVGNDIVMQLHEVMLWAKDIDDIPLGQDAKTVWEKAYYEFEKPDLPELIAAITSRGESQTRRIATIYAILDKSPVVKKEHLLAALEVWRYCEDSVKYVYGKILGNPIAEKIKAHLKEAKNGITRSGLYDLFNRNIAKANIDQALNELSIDNIAIPKKIKTDGRSEERWHYYE